MTDIRIEQIERALVVQRSAIERGARAIEALDLTDKEVHVLGLLMLDKSVQSLESSGAIPSAVTLLDLPVGALECLAAVYGVLAKYDVSLRKDGRLGDALKVLPSEETEFIEMFLNGVSRWVNG